MSGPEEWGATAVEDDPSKWGARSADQPPGPSRVSEGFDALKDKPPQAFVDRIASGALVMRDLFGYSYNVGKSAGEQAIESTKEQLGSINERLNPTSEAYRSGRESGAWTGPGTFLGVGKGLFDVATLPLAPTGAALTEVIAQPYSKLTGMPIEEARHAAGMALLALRGTPNEAVFSRRGGAAGEQTIGTLPKPADFETGADLLGARNKDAVANLQRMWSEEGVHPAEAVHDARSDAFLKHDLTAKPETVEAPADLVEIGAAPRSLSAAVNTDPPLTPLAEQPASPPGSLLEAGRAAVDQLMGLGRNVQFMLDPMATGSNRAMVIAKDAMNSVRRIRWDHARIDAEAVKTFEPEARARMWNAADEESVARQLGESREHQGLVTLEPQERAFIEDAHARAQAAWLHAVDAGIVESEGLPAYTPRMVMNVAAASSDMAPRALNELGRNVFTRTAQMNRRGYMTAEETEAAAKRLVSQRMTERGASADEINAAVEKVKIARDIRALPLATARLQEATVWREMINKIEDVGKQSGSETVAAGFKPDHTWFTIEGHPAFTKWKRETKSVEIPAQGTTVTSTHEMGFDPGLQSGLERVASELGVEIKQPLRHQDPHLASSPLTAGYTSRSGSDVVSTFGHPQTILEHEIGHKIDFRYGLSHEIHSQSPMAWRELGELALHRVPDSVRATYRSQPDFLKKLSSHENFSGIGAYDNYLLSAEERIANMLHAYWYTPKLLRNVAPHAFKWFEEFLSRSPDALKDAIKSVEPSLQIASKRLQENTSVLTNPTSVSVDVSRPVPIYMHPEFRGPMTSILDESASNSKVVAGAQSAYGALMTVKGKAMTAILNSPLIHNEVVWSKVMEAAGGREWLGFGLYFKGNRIVNGNPARAGELIERGLNPMGPRGSFQDITSMMEQPNIESRYHTSWTGKIAGFVPGLFDPAAGAAVEGAIAKAGNFFHNTLLWDRVRDVQFGLADHLSDRLVGKGVDRLTADRIAAHFSNIIVGSIPKEAMSAGARATANMLLFSRSFTLGNLSTFKQAAMGLPKPILAQIERDFGVSAAEALPEAAQASVSQMANSIARRKAVSTIMLSAGLYYVGNALIQHAFNIAARDATLNDEMQGYARRYESLMNDAKTDPFELRHAIGRLSPTYDNEPRKQDRAHIGYDKDGGAIYARNPTGKFGEEMIGYPTMPMDMVRRKLSPMASGILDILENDRGFGRKIYDENNKTLSGDVATAFAVGKHLVMKHLPEGQIQAGVDLLRGDGDPTMNKLRLVAPALGFTVSGGAPGGMARGEQLSAKQEFDTRFSLAWPDIKKQIQRGDIDGAMSKMDEIRVPPMMQRGLIRNVDNPAAALHGRTLRNFYQTGTPEQIERMERAQGR